MLQHVTRLKVFSVETLYINSSPDIIRMIKLRRGELGGTVACWEFTHRAFFEDKVPHIKRRDKFVVNVEKG